ncbi:hypothetical protein AFA91_07225 [Mycolicibacterium goodii]|uniref:Uncharacterized protein n=1 Tax=Mycolicibacterium goodii TaxID=134601 RepID=A0A0K0XFM5_MYCGD|nr:hypothetical protein AFA91_07225 [Mycolicibacterium goodii]
MHGWQPSIAPPQGPQRGNGWKWTLGVIILIAVVGVTAATTLFAASDSKEGGTPSPTKARPLASGSAGAGAAPVSVITNDSSCAAQYPIMTTWIRASNNGWGQRDPSLPASSWSSDVRSQHEEVAEALQNAADQIIPVARLTQHRVMRELYEQFVAYSRAYVASIASYTPPADQFVRVAIAATETIGNICSAIEFGSAASRGALVTPLPSPDHVSSMVNANDPQRFMITPDPVCKEWRRVMDQFKSDTTAWVQTDPNIPGTEWSADQRAINDAVAPVMRRFSNQLLTLAERTANPTLRDFAEIFVQYRNAYVGALSSYLPADQYLALASIRAAGVVNSACEAAVQ